jgi:hypothetical protein
MPERRRLAPHGARLSGKDPAAGKQACNPPFRMFR